MDADTATRATPARGTASRHCPIEDYAIIGDCRTAALINSHGSIDWLCLPHFSAPAVFAALLDTEIGGCFAIRPVGTYRSTQRYVGATPVLQTEFQTAAGVLRLTDLMPIAADEPDPPLLSPQREILRCVEVQDGEVEVEVRYAPRPRYARVVPRVRRRGNLGWAVTDRADLYLLRSDIELTPTHEGRELCGRVRLGAGKRYFLSLSFVHADVGVALPLGDDAQARLQTTLDWWEAWAQRCNYDGPHRELVVRSALTLKLMTFQLSGAIVAAPTTSLPEWIGGTRNWDYRYCWLRDAALTLSAFMDLGFRDEGEAFLGWLLHATRLSRPRLQVLYDVYGETNIRETTLDHLAGYRASRPVRIGNAAHGQLQLDIYGAVILTAFEFVERGGTLDRDECRFLAELGNSVCEMWHLPDAGIWEIRGELRHHTFSKLMCWVALDRLLTLHERGGLRIDAERLQRERDAIAQEIETDCYHDTLGGYRAYVGAALPDPSLLLMARYGYKSARDPRLRATFARLESELARGVLFCRAMPPSDELNSPEGAFVIAGFWAVDYLARAGELDQARARFAKLLALANRTGLYAEEIDPNSGAALGNFPQAYSHVGLITAALALMRAQPTSREAA